MSASDPGVVSPVPEHLHTVTPRLVVSDGAAAIAFYARAFGAGQIGERFTGPGGELIHAEIRIGDSVVMITEDAVDGPVSSPERLGGKVTRLFVKETDFVRDTTVVDVRYVPLTRIRLPIRTARL